MSDLLPPNATPQERALSEAVARVGAVPVIVREMWNPATCPSNLLPWLAWAMSVDNWDSSWNDNQKRATIAAAIDVHKHKGTIGAVQSALAALGYTANIQEWFAMTPPGNPYTFDLIVESNSVGIDETAIAKIVGYISGAKNLRSHLRLIRPAIVTQANTSLASVTMTANYTTVNYDYRTLDGSLTLDGSWTLDGSKQF